MVFLICSRIGTQMLTSTIKEELKKIFGEGNVSCSREDLLCYSYDATNSMRLPEAVVFPSCAEEVSSIMKLANSEGFSVTPRGAGTGFSGGSVPVEGGVVMSFERMKRILSIDTDNLTAVVEPGVNTWEFQQEVESRGLFYPPDPTSLKFSTIGGNIAECAGGPRAVKYGVTKDYVLGLEVVLPTGEIIKTGAATVKGVVGYDLTKLIVGSEGTLGIVTKATLRLLPLPEHTITSLAVFSSLKGAAQSVSDIIREKVIPSTLEFIDSTSLRCVEQYAKIGLPAAGAVLLIEVDGSAQAAQKEAQKVREVCMSNGAVSVNAANGKNEVKDLWKARRAISASLYRIRPNKINEDIVVPRASIPALIAGIEEISGSLGILIACFGHAGDGNVHVNVMYDKGDPKEAATAERAVEEVFKLTLGLGGTISGEHGVGIAKAKYIGMELSPAVIGLMKEIKKTFDPNGVLNPGKIFPPGETARDAVYPEDAGSGARKMRN